MQRHKQPLNFVESPYRGSKRFVSPVLAARRPYLAPSVVVEELKDQWVSPQFRPDEDLSPFKKPRRRTRKARAKPSNNKTVEAESKENTNVLFPQLEFLGATTAKNLQGCEANVSRTKAKNILKDKAQSVKPPRSCKNDTGLFLFQLGSPKTPTVPGKVLVRETPEEQIRAERWTNRLRSGK